MTFSLALRAAFTGAVCAIAWPASAHVALEQKTATAGSAYKAVFQVGHGCNGSATTGITVQMPAGFQHAQPYPKAGWTLSTQTAKLAKPYDSHGKTVTQDVSVVSWVAASREAALPDAYFDEFTMRGQLAAGTGPMWFKVLQTCESGGMDWSDVPASGTSTNGLKAPAPLLDVVDDVSPAEAAAATPRVAERPSAQPVQVRDGWARSTVPGQKGTGAFMKITAAKSLRLVGVQSPAAGVAEVHEMKLEGDVMKMRPVNALELPAGKTVELKAGGFHVMLLDLKQPLAAGSTVPLTLLLKDAKGVESRVEVKLPVATSAPAGSRPGAAGAPAAQDDHSAHRH